MTFSYLYENSNWQLAIGYWLFIASSLVVTTMVMVVCMKIAVGYWRLAFGSPLLPIILILFALQGSFLAASGNLRFAAGGKL